MSCNTQIAIGAGKICHFIFSSHLSASSLQSSVMSPRDTVHVSKCKRELPDCSLVSTFQPKSTCKKGSFLLTLTSILSILNVDHFVTSTTLPLAKENTHRNNVRNKCSRAMGENDILLRLLVTPLSSFQRDLPHIPFPTRRRAAACSVLPMGERHHRPRTEVSRGIRHC